MCLRFKSSTCYKYNSEFWRTNCGHSKLCPHLCILSTRKKIILIIRLLHIVRKGKL